MGSMSSRGWGFRKVESSFPYFLFLVSYSLFPFRSLLLCELCVKQKKVEEVGDFRLPMLLFVVCCLLFGVGSIFHFAIFAS